MRFCVRSTVAGLVSFVISRLLAFPVHGLWMVLTSVLVIHVSIDGSVQAAIPYLAGTVIGAIYAAIITVFVPPTTLLAQAVALVLAIAPLSFAAAFHRSFQVAPFSGVMVIIASGQLNEAPIASALYRSLEVALGGAIAVIVSLLVFPQRANTSMQDSITPIQLSPHDKRGAT